jgi:hypothetical protein
MKRLWVLACALAFCGCISDSDKKQWAEAWKDARGDNMQMRNDFSTPSITPLKKASD